MQWFLENLFAIVSAIAGAVGVMGGFIWNMDRRTRDNSRDIVELRKDMQEAKSARVELHRIVEDTRASLSKVAGDTNYIRGFLERSSKDGEG